MTTSAPERFWSKVEKTDGCWIWRASCFKSGGYGQFRLGDRSSQPARAHRVSWEWEHGPIPAGLQVLHSCDNPPCVRPDHLFLGTHDDNMADMAAKIRAPREFDNKQCKISDQQVREIRALRGVQTCYSVAEQYGISFGYVARIWRGEERALALVDE